METVEPIRDKDILMAMLDYLYARNERDYMLFMVGINTGLRISDILTLKVGQLKNRSKIAIREKKTGKVKELPLNDDLRQAIRRYTADKAPSEWMFPSQKGKGIKPIQRSRAYKILREAADAYGVQHVGTHTMRKTFGYHFYHASGKDVTLLMYLFNHKDPSVTLRYIGVTATTAYNAMKKFSFYKT